MLPRIIYDINSDALGDNIACLPALLNHKFTGEKYVKSKYIEIFKLFGFKDPDEEKLSSYAIRIYPNNMNKDKNVFTFLNRNHLCSYAQAVLKINDLQYELPTIPPVNKTNEILISATSYDIIRFIPPIVIDTLCREIRDLGYIPVLTGNTKNRDLFYYEHKNKYATNMINKTNLLETLDLINRATAIITPDSGLMWLTYLTNTNLIASFFTVDPIFRFIKRKAKTTIIYPNCECRFCFSKGYIIKNMPSCQIGKNINKRWKLFKSAIWECHKSVSYKEYIRALKEMLK